MSGKLAKVAAASATTLMLMAGTAAAGDYYGRGYGGGLFGGYGGGCNCGGARVRAVYGVQPVTYYETQQVYVPQVVTVPRTGYVATQSYVVDQGPTYDVPAVSYAAPSVSYPQGGD